MQSVRSAPASWCLGRFGQDEAWQDPKVKAWEAGVLAPPTPSCKAPVSPGSHSPSHQNLGPSVFSSPGLATASAVANDTVLHCSRPFHSCLPFLSSPILSSSPITQGSRPAAAETPFRSHRLCGIPKRLTHRATQEAAAKPTARQLSNTHL